MNPSVEPTELDWRLYGPVDLPRILAAALEVFVEHGYHGASIRDVAAASGLSVPGVYHHYRSKQQILAGLMMATMDDLLARSRAALESASDEPGAAYDAVVESMLRFHMQRREQAFVGSSEIRSLDVDNRAVVVARRDEQQLLVREALERGVREGRFHAEHAGDVARAVSSLCVGVASWYRDDGPLSADEVVRRHLVMTRALAGVVG